MKKGIFIFLLVLGMLVENTDELNVTASESGWKYAYEQEIIGLDDFYGGIIAQLVDLDIDGSPELIIGGGMGSGLFSCGISAFSYINGQARALNFADEDSFFLSRDGYTLYHNPLSNEYRIEGGYILRAGMGNSSRIISIFGLKDNVVFEQDQFAEVIENGEPYYYNGDSLCTASEYNNAINTWRYEWDKVNNFAFCEVFWDKRPSDGEIRAFFDQYPESNSVSGNSSYGISVLLNGTNLSFDQPPVIINDRTMVPIRTIFEAMGYLVDWDQMTQMATATRGNDIIYVHIGNNIIWFTTNNVTGEYYCDVPPQIISERILVPIRAIAESAGCNVDWDGNTKTVIINYSNTSNTRSSGSTSSDSNSGLISE